jgi:hypothetical protein
MLLPFCALNVPCIDISSEACFEPPVLALVSFEIGRMLQQLRSSACLSIARLPKPAFEITS